MNVPGGGSVLVPEPYDRAPRYPTYGARIAEDVLVRYRNWRSTLSGHPECDGMITIARADRFDSLQEFMTTSRAGLSIQWSAADKVAGTAWTANKERYPVEQRDGERGPELLQALAVHRVGWFDVYDDPTLMYVAGDRNGLNIGVWITSGHGGARRASSLVQRIAASFES